MTATGVLSRLPSITDASNAFVSEVPSRLVGVATVVLVSVSFSEVFGVAVFLSASCFASSSSEGGGGGGGSVTSRVTGGG